MMLKKTAVITAILLCIIILAGCRLPIPTPDETMHPVVAETVAPQDSTDPYDFIVTDYLVRVNVQENNIQEVQEEITVDFLRKMHGIYRWIPYDVTMSAGAEKKACHLKISDIRVNNKYETSDSGQNINIKIGDPNVNVTGEVKYVISYTIDPGADRFDSADIVQYSTPEWEVPIRNMRYVFSLPKGADPRVEVCRQKEGGAPTSDDAGTGFNDAKDDIRIAAMSTMEPHEIMTVRITLPEGYFKR